MLTVLSRTRAVARTMQGIVAQALLLVPAMVGAQAQRPSAPDTTPVRTSGRVELILKHDAPAPWQDASRSFRILLATASTAAMLDSESAVDSLNATCGGPVTGGGPPGWVDTPLAPDHSYFVIAALRGSDTRGGCWEGWNARPLSVWSGLSFGVAGDLRTASAYSLRLLVDNVPVEPKASVARPAWEFRGVSWTAVPSQLRYYYPMPLLAPRADGAAHRLTVQAWNSEEISWTVDVPDSIAQRMRFDYAAWRIATSAPASSARSGALVPLHAVAPEVRRVIELSGTADADVGAVRAAEYLGRAGRNDSNAYSRDVATMLVADALLRRGDDAGARAIIAGAVSVRSCIAAPSGASLALLNAVAAERGRPCVTHSAAGTFVTGLVIPGGGHFVAGNTGVGIIAAGLIGSVFANAIRIDRKAQQQYAAYEGNRNYKTVSTMYEDAVESRQTARRVAFVGVGLAVADALIAVIETTFRHALLERGRL